MGSMSLFLDSTKNGQFPTLAKEALSQSEKRGITLEATLTPDNYCAILSSNAILTWPTKAAHSSPNKSRPLRAFKLELPRSGLHYSLKCFDTFRQAGQQHASAVAVSPTGLLRYWPRVESASLPIDEQINFGGEVVQSLCNLGPVDDSRAQLFLICTTTETFYTATISSGADSPISITRLHLKGASSTSSLGIGRRVTAMLFGTGADKDHNIVKVLAAGRRLLDADACVLTQSRVQMLSLASNSVIAEIDVTEAVKGEQRDLHDIRVIDADLLNNDLLLLISCRGLDGDHISMLLGLLRGRKKAASRGLSLVSLVPVLLPERVSATGQDSLDMTRLIAVDRDDCVVVFKNALLYVHNPTDPKKVPPNFMESFEDQLLGCGRTDGGCHLIFKRSGICVVRELPACFELDFWAKNERWLEADRGAVDEGGILESRIYDAFLEFCRKDMRTAKNIVDALGLDDSGEEVLAKTLVRMVKHLLNRTPPNDPRWSNPPSNARDDEDESRFFITSSKDFGLHVRQLGDKLTHLKMFVAYMRYCRLHEMAEKRAVSSIAEMEEDVLAALFFAKWLHQCHNSDEVKQFKLVTASVERAGEEWANRFGHVRNRDISGADHLFKEVTHFHEFLPQLVGAEKRKLKEVEEGTEEVSQSALLVWEANASVVSIVEGIQRAGSEDWSLLSMEGESRAPSATGQGGKWARIALEQLNVALEFLSSTGVVELAANEEEFCDAIVEQCATIARFVLTLQEAPEPDRVNNSPIISAFYSIGRRDTALKLAREFRDFTLLIRDCHERMKGEERAAQLDTFRDDFKAHDFDLILYDYYRMNGMVEQLLAEKDNRRLSQYLAAHEKINWIRNVELGDYWSAKRTLKSMATKCESKDTKMVLLSLCKLCALCEDEENIDELAELSESIEALSDNTSQ